MIVERLDIYDFKLWVMEGEFTMLKIIADERKMPIEVMISMFITTGIMEAMENLE